MSDRQVSLRTLRICRRAYQGSKGEDVCFAIDDVANIGFRTAPVYISGFEAVEALSFQNFGSIFGVRQDHVRYLESTVLSISPRDKNVARFHIWRG